MLLAGPGTGKTTCIKGIVDGEFAAAKKILVLSFTNATVNDLRRDFEDNQAVDCCTLHSYAMRINPLGDRYVLDTKRELPVVEKAADDIGVDLRFLCEILRCISFDSMVAECLLFLKANPAYGSKQIGDLDLLVVDEFQDFNAGERDLVMAVSAFARETIVLGDDDQSIYDFKDADPDGIIRLYETPGIELIPHEHLCHRCPDVVVDCAARLIAHNTHRIEKPWQKTARTGDCFQRQFTTQHEANEFIVNEILRVRTEEDPQSPSSILALSPVSYYADDLILQLEANGIDYVSFWASPLSDEDWLRLWRLRAIYGERRVLNLVFLARLLTPHFRGKFKDVLREAVTTGYDEGVVLDQIARFYGGDLESLISEPPPLAELVARYPDFEVMATKLDAGDLATSVDALLRALNSPTEFERASVNVMSIHRSKGLQADIVFINGLVDGVLPNGASGVDTIEAQRRLLYVGVTRARDTLHLLAAVEWDGKYVQRLDKSQFEYDYRGKVWNGRASRFLSEMA